MITENLWFNPKYSCIGNHTAIFADRDGTLIRHVDYIDNPDAVELLPGVKGAIHRIISENIPFFIMTNQSGVGRGYFQIEKVYACQARLFELLEIDPAEIAGWCIAPEGPEVSGGYRKPSPRFIRDACDHLQTTPANCHMIGDTLVDLETAWASGAQAWAVRCGKPELPERIRSGDIEKPHQVLDSFADCVESILQVRI